MIADVVRRARGAGGGSGDAQYLAVFASKLYMIDNFSLDFLDWTEVSDEPEPNYIWSRVWWIDALGAWFASCYDLSLGSSGKLYRSTNGTSWTEVYNGDAVRGLAWSPPLGMAALVTSYADFGSTTRGRAFTSEDGNTWTQRNSNNVRLYDVCWADSNSPGRFAAVGVSGRTSTDGINWTNNSIARDFTAVVDVPSLGLTIAAGNEGIGTSTSNGSTWTIRSHPAIGFRRDVAWSPQLGVAAVVGSGGAVTSTNGTSWSSLSGAPSNLYVVEWIEPLGMFVMLGASASNSTLYTWDATTLTSGPSRPITGQAWALAWRYT